MAPIAVIACLQFLFAPCTVALIDTDPEYVAWAVPSLRRILVNIHAVVALIIAAYWLFVATLGGGQFLRIRGANIVLALSGLLVALFMVDWSGAGNPGHALLKGLCPLLGLSDEQLVFEGTFGFVPKLPPCAEFTGNVRGILFLVLPIILLIASAILRIVVSRRRDGDGAASAVHASPLSKVQRCRCPPGENRLQESCFLAGREGAAAPVRSPNRRAFRPSGHRAASASRRPSPPGRRAGSRRPAGREGRQGRAVRPRRVLQ